VPPRRPTLAALLALGVGGAVAGTGIRATSSEGKAPSAAATALAAAADALPRPARPAFEVGRPVRLPLHERLARYAPVAQAVTARARPSATSTPVARLALETPEGTTNLVLVVGDVTRRDGEWIHVRLPVLPNDRTGWVPRAALGGYRFVHTRLVVDRKRLRVVLYDDGRAIFRAPIGIGRPAWPTPAGRFYVREKLSGFGNPFYGPIAYGTSARSSVLTDWPGGGFVGIHGTNEPDLIPGRISHGCVRLRNPDILRLSRLMPVGTPVTIE
jgi:lipoprotein-anchoring transpeptidase ErfK/SrfK